MGKKLEIGFELVESSEREKELAQARKSNSVARQIFKAVNELSDDVLKDRTIKLSEKLTEVQVHSMANSINQLLKETTKQIKAVGRNDDEKGYSFIRFESTAKNEDPKEEPKEEPKETKHKKNE